MSGELSEEMSEEMSRHNVRFGAVLVAWLGIQVVLYGLAFGWVWIYSVAIEPGHDHAFYEAYAQVSSPIVAILASLPACWLAARWIRSRVGEASAIPTAIAAGALLVAIDVGATVALVPLEDAWICLVAVPLELAGGWLALRGIRTGEPALAT